MADNSRRGSEDLLQPRPNPRFVAILIGVAMLVLGVGAALRPEAKQGPVVVPSNELATLPERSQRRALRDMAEYVAERSAAVGASVVFLPDYGTSGLVVAPDTVLTVVSSRNGPGENIEYLLTRPLASDTAPTVAPRIEMDTSPARWALVVARASTGRTLALTGLTGGLMDAQCGDLSIRELVFDAVIPAAFAGGGVFDLDGRTMALATPCAGRIGLVPLAEVTRLLQEQRTPGHQLWRRFGFRVEALDSLTGAALGAGQGLVVTELSVGAAAHSAGLRPGDVIVRIAGQPVSQVEDLTALLEAEERSTLVIRQRGTGVTISTTRARGPSSSAGSTIQSRAGGGTLLTAVPSGSRAAAAGLRVGDRILHIGRNRQPTAAAVQRALADSAVVFVVYERAGRQRGLLLR
jgi:hypothetical protein